MNQTYIANVRNLVENTDRRITVVSPNAMEAHKSVYRDTTKKEEISDITGPEGDIVFDTEKGFKRK